MSKGQSARESGFREAQRISDEAKRREREFTLTWSKRGDAKIESSSFGPNELYINGAANVSGSFTTSWDPSSLFTTTGTSYPSIFGEVFITAPNPETLSELLGLAEGEEVVSYAVKLPDGSIDVRVLER